MNKQKTKEEICICGHDKYSHNWTSEKKKYICIGENPYWSGCDCKCFKEKK